MKKAVYAVFDIGKTNKKLLLFDEDQQVLEERQEVFAEIKDEDGFPCDDVDRLTDWLLATWADLQRDARYAVKGVNFTAYGASFVHIGHDGKPVLPLYNYLKPLPEAVAAQFYAELDEHADAFAACTCSPRLGMLNSGLQLYWIRHTKPDVYQRIRYSLHLPQYLSFLLSGETFSDYTSVGCHTALWNFQKGDYHTWVKRERIDEKLAPLTRDSVASVVDGVLVGIGLHDSSAALMPYLLQSEDPFLLISTGTWCINLNPFNNAPLTTDGLHRDCLSYLSPKGRQTKASRVFFGREHDFQTERIAAHFGLAPDFYKSLAFARPVSPLKPFRPACMSGTGPFPDQPAADWDLSVYASAEEAYQHLMDGLLDILQESISLIDTGERILYIDGGFARNAVFMQGLAKRFPDRSIRTLDVPQATALGAMMHLQQGEAHRQTRLLFT